MSSAVALAVGVVFGLLFMVCLSLWVVVRGRLPMRAAYAALPLFIIGSVVLAILAGSLKSAILLTLGAGVGLALSSVITLPLGELARRRHYG